jgi:dephospho-CoA kinase
MSREPYLLGLTGSIGMGKSTTARLFAEADIPVWDADAAVHRLYAQGGGGAEALAELVPDAIGGGAVDRAALREAILADPGLLAQVEARIHPLVARDRGGFVERYRTRDLIVFDIPLLYETGAEAWLDGVLVVTAPEAVQRARVLERPGMSEAALWQILARQVPDDVKRARADFVIETDAGIEPARRAVRALADSIRRERTRA